MSLNVFGDIFSSSAGSGFLLFTHLQTCDNGKVKPLDGFYSRRLLSKTGSIFLAVNSKEIAS
jgi:hypothetical protein